MKKKNQDKKSLNKGFTLVELIAVIVIISVIAIMSFASMTKTIKNSQIKEIEVFETNLKRAAQIYIETNLSDFSQLDNAGGSVQITTATLISKGYLDKNINNPSDCSLANTFVVATKQEDKTIEYTVSCVGDPVEEPTYAVYSNGTALYFNPVTGSACAPEDAVSTTGTKTGCMKWYAFNDGGSSSSTINLILDHNTTAVVAWNSTASNVSGPNEVLTQLKSDTSSWAGVSTRTDSYSVNNGTATYTIDYSTYKARLITAAEIATITGNSSFVESTAISSSWFYLDSKTHTQTVNTQGASNYDWLFDYTNGCTSYGCNIADASNKGYWTSTAGVGTTYGVWLMQSYGILDLDDVNITVDGGVRPVITINKSIFIPR